VFATVWSSVSRSWSRHPLAQCLRLAVNGIVALVAEVVDGRWSLGLVIGVGKVAILCQMHGRQQSSCMDAAW